jgi:hypothetical protein
VFRDPWRDQHDTILLCASFGGSKARYENHPPNKAPPNRKRAAEADHRAEAGQTLTPNAIAAFEVLLISNSLAYCELYLAFADMGPNPVCARDHCDCDGTTPLLSSEVSGTWTMNCDYAVQPVTALALGH